MNNRIGIHFARKYADIVFGVSGPTLRDLEQKTKVPASRLQEVACGVDLAQIKALPMELIYLESKIIPIYFDPFVTLIFTALIYFTLTFSTSTIMGLVERKYRIPGYMMFTRPLGI